GLLRGAPGAGARCALPSPPAAARRAPRSAGPAPGRYGRRGCRGSGRTLPARRPPVRRCPRPREACRAELEPDLRTAGEARVAWGRAQYHERRRRLCVGNSGRRTVVLLGLEFAFISLAVAV